MWSSYLLSVAISFILFSVVVNVVGKFNRFDKDTRTLLFYMSAVCSLFWMFTVPLAMIGCVAYLINHGVSKVVDKVLLKLKKGEDE